MHRAIEITVSSESTSWLLRELEGLEHVIGLSVQRGVSVKPPGDVVVVHALNRGVDDVLRCAATAGRRGHVSIVTAEVASIIDPAREQAVANDVDEAIWEEAETGLRHQARVTTNYLVLMALGGAIAAAGLVSDPVPQAVNFVAASVIAPDFEPLAKIPLGLALRRWNVVRRGLVSTCAAIAGVVMVLAYRRTVIAGPLVALVLIPAAALIGAGLGAGRPSLAVEGLERLALDAFLIVGLGTLVVLIKQATVHRRLPLV